MLRLTTLGGLALGQDDEVLTGAPTQRRRLALLAMLAVAGEKGISRDKLLAVLWPEGDEKKSRHALNQILSAQRRYFQDEQLFAGRKTVRLNPELISSDIAMFNAALQTGDLDRAVELYGGPFLDGFFISGSMEFEMWASDQRSRIAARLLDALDKAAAEASTNGDHTSLVKWRRHALELDRTDSSRAMKLANALVLSGNNAGALRVLTECQRRISAELGVSGDPEVSRMIDEINGRMR